MFIQKTQRFLVQCVFSLSHLPLFAQDKDIRQNPDLEERLMCMTAFRRNVPSKKKVLHKCLCQRGIKLYLGVEEKIKETQFYLCTMQLLHWHASLHQQSLIFICMQLFFVQCVVFVFYLDPDAHVYDLVLHKVRHKDIVRTVLALKHLLMIRQNRGGPK